MTFLKGFMLGVVTGFLSNLLYDYVKNIRRGKKPFVETRVSGDMIKFSGQINNTNTGQTALNKMIQNVN